MSAPAVTGGLADYAQLVFARADLQPTWDALMARASASPPDVGAMLDLSTILQLVGQREQGLALQADALARQRHYRRTLGTGRGPRLLALVAAGDMMASTPVEFMLAGWNGELDLYFLRPDDPPLDAALGPIPEHDLAILAVGESDANAPILAALAEAVAKWPKPMLNAAPDSIAALGRDRAPARLAGARGLVAPPTQRTPRDELAALASGFPMIVRPVDSHAGAGLEKLMNPTEVTGYLARRPEPLFYVSPFIDYAGGDGRFRKLRVALVAGRPFIVHMAVSDHWMIHYLNAGMDADPVKRGEEAALMESFDAGFAARHARAFAALHRTFGLDYFAVDCAEDREGRLLLFEADTAMIVHDMDPPDLYPYKAPAMAKLFAAFQALVAARL
jgi:glutathione synthase/RimK-type ligase-like ATP-grasp enzyme